MPKLKQYQWVAMCLAFILSACQAPMQPNELIISAASSLQDVIGEIVEEFKQKYPDTPIHINVGGSNQLKHQILEGFPVDIFLSAHEDPVLSLNDQGRVAKSESFATSTIVLVSSISRVKCIYDLATPGVTLALSNPEVPIGKYSQLILQKIEENQAGFYDAVQKNVNARPLNVRQGLFKASLQESDAVFAYSTDLNSEFPQLTVIDLPEAYRIEAVFYAALIKNDAQINPIAREFYEFIHSEKVQEVLTAHGFN